ncbi:MAG: hypothetical protein ABIQ95_13260 [Bdellovibrionia bacterium]
MEISRVSLASAVCLFLQTLLGPDLAWAADPRPVVRGAPAQSLKPNSGTLIKAPGNRILPKTAAAGRKRRPQSDLLNSPPIDNEPEYGSLSLPKLQPGQKNEIIKDLSFVKPDKVLIQWESAPDAKPRRVAKIIGNFPRGSGRTFTVPDYPNALVWTQAEGSNEFTFTAPILSERSLFRFQAVDTRGKIENQTVVLPLKKKVKAGVPQWVGSKPTVSLGIMMFNFLENYRLNSLAFDISEILSTLKVSYNLQGSTWDLGLSAFYTPVILSNSSAGGYDSKLLIFDLKLGYIMPKIVSPWRLSFAAGLIYTTMMVPSNYYGYKNTIGPQLSSMIQRILGSNDTLYFYAKLTPFPTSTFSFGFGNREYCLGIGLLRPLKNDHPLSLNFEYSDFLATVDAFYRNTSDIHYLHSTSLSLNLSYGF